MRIPSEPRTFVGDLDHATFGSVGLNYAAVRQSQKHGVWGSSRTSSLIRCRSFSFARTGSFVRSDSITSSSSHHAKYIDSVPRKVALRLLTISTHTSQQKEPTIYLILQAAGAPAGPNPPFGSRAHADLTRLPTGAAGRAWGWLVPV
jgi:hypothetical protein